MYWFSSSRSAGEFALNRYLIRVTTFVIVSIRPKFSILTIFPISDEWSASKGSMPFGNSSGYSSENFSAKSGMYTSPMHPMTASQRSCCLLNIFCAM